MRDLCYNLSLTCFGLLAFSGGPAQMPWLADHTVLCDGCQEAMKKRIGGHEELKATEVAYWNEKLKKVFCCLCVLDRQKSGMQTVDPMRWNRTYEQALAAQGEHFREPSALELSMVSPTPAETVPTAKHGAHRWLDRGAAAPRVSTNSDGSLDWISMLNSRTEEIQQAMRTQGIEVSSRLEAIEDRLDTLEQMLRGVLCLLAPRDQQGRAPTQVVCQRSGN